MKTHKDIILSVCSTLVILCSCGETTRRPQNIPSTAVKVEGSFINCTTEHASRANRCVVYEEKSGQVLLSGLFVLSGAGREAEQADLRYKAFDGKSILLADARSLEPLALHEWALPSGFANRLALFAGGDAIDCGRVPLQQDPNSASDCAFAAHKQKKPFLVTYDEDSVRGISEGFGGNSAGDIYYVKYAVTAFPNRPGLFIGGAEKSEGDHLRFGPCAEPPALVKNELGRLTCSQSVVLPHTLQN